MLAWLECPACKKPIMKGDSDAESNLRRETMLGVGEKEKGAG